MRGRATQGAGNRRLRTPEETAKHLALAEKRRKACELHVAGHNLDEIARQLGYATRSGAWRAIQRTLKEHTRPASEQERARAISRAEWLWGKASGRVESTGAEPKSVQAAAKVLEHLADLEGTNAPKKVEQIPHQLGVEEAKVLLVKAMDRARQIVGQA